MFTGDLSDVSEETITLLTLIASCSLQDVDNIQGRGKGKATDGLLTDAELALELFAEEARALQTLAGDMILAHSIDRAVHADAALLQEHTCVEEMARHDRKTARAIAEGRPPPTRTIGSAQSSSTSAIESSLVRGTSTLSSSRKTLIAKPSSSANRLPNGARVPPVVCVICRDTINGPVIYAPCGDAYGVDCLVDLFRAATVDESLFPPSCCRRPFDIDRVRQYFTKDLATLVDKKTTEFGTKNRVYCCRSSCSTFLGAATSSASRICCSECWAETCGHCKAAAHPLSIRCTSTEDAGVIALAAEAGWKRCPGCGHLVELTMGCYHMTCRCRHQFCYLCLATWKQCACTQWDEHRLVVAAEDRVERRERAQGIQIPVGNRANRQAVVAREAERLRENHECVHRWRYVAQAGDCEGCGHYLRLFLFHCSGCYIRMCARCKSNRWFP